MALIVEGIFISKTVTSLQLKVHECYIKPLKPRGSLLSIEEEESDIEENNESENVNIEDLILKEAEESD